MFKENGPPELAKLVAGGVKLYRSVAVSTHLFLACNYKVGQGVRTRAGRAPVVE